MTLPLIFANRARSTVAGPISSSATSMTVAAGTGALFPQPAAGQYFVLTLQDAATGQLYEIVWVTAVSSDAFTIVRGQENTAPRAWSTGDVAANLLTAGTIATLESELFSFTPVQQGGGASQGNNKVYLGWDAPNGHLRFQVDANDGGDLATTVDVANEGSARIAADNAEASTRASADSSLSSAISTEASTRSTNDGNLQTQITNEASARSSGDSTLQTNLNSEATTRSNADGALQSNITAETNARYNEDTYLSGQITAETNARVAYSFPRASFYLSTGGMAEWPTPQGEVFEQWGSVTVPPNSQQTAFYFPAAFPNACLSIVISFGNDLPPSQGAVGAAPINNAQFAAVCTTPGTGAGLGCFFRAIGY